MGENKKFEWTDETVKDFFEWLPKGDVKFSSAPYLIEVFKQSKTSIPLDYEILEFTDGIFSYVRNRNNFFTPNNFSHDYGHPDEKTMLNTIGVKIYSVKRKSDSEIFTIGDEVEYMGIVGKIENFVPFENTMLAQGDKEPFQVSIKKLSKIKPIILTTEDGVEIRNLETKVYYIDSLFKIRLVDAFEVTSGVFKTFFSEEEAKNYIVINRPCLSVSDIIENSPPDWVHTFYLEILKNLVQQKINGK